MLPTARMFCQWMFRLRLSHSACFGHTHPVTPILLRSRNPSAQGRSRSSRHKTGNESSGIDQHDTCIHRSVTCSVVTLTQESF